MKLNKNKLPLLFTPIEKKKKEKMGCCCVSLICHV